MAGKAENQCLVLLAKFGHGGQESSPKPPQAICKPLGIIKTHHHSKLKLIKIIKHGRFNDNLENARQFQINRCCKNYKQYGYDEETRNSAISILEEEE